MFVNLMVEMKRKGFNGRSLAEKSQLTYQTFMKKMGGSGDFTIKEAIAIKKALDSDMPVETLFEETT